MSPCAKDSLWFGLFPERSIDKIIQSPSTRWCPEHAKAAAYSRLFSTETYSCIDPMEVPTLHGNVVFIFTADLSKHIGFETLLSSKFYSRSIKHSKFFQECKVSGPVQQQKLPVI